MAFIVSSDAQLIFFTKVFGNHPVTQKAKALIGAGVTFEVSLYALRAYTDHGKTGQGSLTLTAGTTALIKGTVDAVVTGHNKNLIEGWITSLYNKLGQPAVPQPKTFESTDAILTDAGIGNKLILIKAVLTATGKSLKESKDIVEGIPSKLGSYPSLEAATKVEQIVKAAGGVVVLQPTGKTLPPFTTFHIGKPVTGGLTDPPTKPKPVPEVISLKDAKALGQKVHGTSSGSVYHTIALSEHVKLAARLMSGGAVSIRAEWTDNPTAELKLLQDAGVSLKSNYGSIHFDAANVPLQRVVGAFLVGVGINWKAAVVNGAELVVQS